MRTNDEIRKAKSTAWGWSLFAIFMTLLTICSDDVPLLVALLPFGFAVVCWVVILDEERKQKAENDDLFNSPNVGR